MSGEAVVLSKGLFETECNGFVAGSENSRGVRLWRPRWGQMRACKSFNTSDDALSACDGTTHSCGGGIYMNAGEMCQSGKNVRCRISSTVHFNPHPL